MHGQDLEISAGGIPVNDVSNVHGQGYADLHFLPPEIVSRVDALPGAFDPAQGDFAIAGSLRYHLGYDRPGITAKGTLGSFDSRRLFLAYRPPGQRRRRLRRWRSTRPTALASTAQLHAHRQLRRPGCRWVIRCPRG